MLGKVAKGVVVAVSTWPTNSVHYHASLRECEGIDRPKLVSQYEDHTCQSYDDDTS